MYKKPKIVLIGAGNIGGTIAHLALLKQLGNIVLFDVKEGLPQGKALDLLQAAAIDNIDINIKGTNDFGDISDADIVIVTAGSPRKPGMSRDDLLNINALVMNDVGIAIKTYCPRAFVICVTNPLDAMVYLLQQKAELADHQIVGMAGVLDAARFKYFLAEHFNTSLKNIDAFVLGGHGDTMVPLVELSTVHGMNLKQHVARGTLTEEQLSALVQRTRMGGGEIVNLLKVGSAYYAPAVSALHMAEAVLYNKHLLVSAASKIQTAYGVPRPMFLGVPTVLGAVGVERILELPLSQEEHNNLQISIKSVAEMISDLERLKFI
jgi:malate dehydrogenase